MTCKQYEELCPYFLANQLCIDIHKAVSGNRSTLCGQSPP
jgi:hypothetical protein